MFFESVLQGLDFIRMPAEYASILIILFFLSLTYAACVFFGFYRKFIAIAPSKEPDFPYILDLSDDVHTKTVLRVIWSAVYRF